MKDLKDLSLLNITGNTSMDITSVEFIMKRLKHLCVINILPNIKVKLNDPISYGISTDDIADAVSFLKSRVKAQKLRGKVIEEVKPESGIRTVK